MPLSPDGEREAAALGAALAGEGIAAVLSSPRERALATAGPVARAAGLATAVEPALDEIDFGDWTGAAFADLDGRADWDEWNARRGGARAPGGESMAEAVARAAACADALAAGPPGLVALVTHCDVIRGLLARLLGMPLDNLLRLEVSPASVSRVLWGRWGRVLTVNETGLRRTAA